MSDLAHSIDEDKAKALILRLEKEAKALGSDVSAALLFHEIARLWETPLKNGRNAALAYQMAFQLDPRFVENIRSARRLFAEAGNWRQVVQFLDAELACCSADSRPSLLFEKARVMEKHLSLTHESTRVYKQCLEVAGQDINVLTKLEFHFFEKRDAASLVQVYRLMAESAGDASTRAQQLTAAGILLEHELGKPKEAADLFRAAFALDRKDPILVFALKRRAEKDGRLEELLNALMAEALLNGEDAASTFLEIAKIYHRLNRLPDAIAALQAGRRANPSDRLILHELAVALESAQKYEEFADVLLSLASLPTDKHSAIEINLRLASLYEDKLAQEQYAITRYQTILSKSPGHPVALSGLGKLYARHQDWVGLVATYDAEIAATEEPKLKASKLYKSAQVLEERLGRVDQAIARYQQCLQWLPVYLPAQKALARRYAADGRYEELALMLEADLPHIDDRDYRISSLTQLAEIYEVHLNNPSKAIEFLKQALEESPKHRPTLRLISRLYEQEKRWREFIATNETEASLSQDLRHSLFLLHRNAEILDEELQDKAGATQAYERLLSMSPTYLPALQALGRLYSQEGRWADLIRIYLSEVEVTTSSPNAAALTFKVAELYEHNLRDLQQAMKTYQEAIRLSSEWFVPAAQALARVYRELKDWPSLIELLRKQSVHQGTELERANTLFQVACLWEDTLQNTSKAIETHEEILRLWPSHVASMQALQRLITPTQPLKKQIHVLEQMATKGLGLQGLAARLHLAHLCFFEIKDLDAARHWVDEALRIEPEHIAALRLKTRLSIDDQFKRTELQNRTAERQTDPRMKAAYRLAAQGQVAESTNSTTLEDALSSLKVAYRDHPEAPAYASELESLLMSKQQHQELLDWYSLRISHARDLSDRATFLIRRAQLLEFQLGDLNRASQSYAQALEIMPHWLSALEGQARIALQLEQLPLAATALETIGASAHDSAIASQAWYEAAEVFLRQQNPTEARRCLSKALERWPQHAEAQALARTLETPSPSVAPIGDDASENPMSSSIDIISEAMQSIPIELEDDLEPLPLVAFKKPSSSERPLETVGLPDAENAASLMQPSPALAPAESDVTQFLNSGDWASAHLAVERLIENTSAWRQRVPLLLQLAAIRHEGFHDLPGALQVLDEALEASLSIPEMWPEVDKAYLQVATPSALIQALEQLLQRITGDTLALELEVRTCELFAGPAEQPEQAILRLRQLFEKHPNSVRPLVALASLYSRFPHAAPVEIETHRAVLRLEPTRASQLHSLFRLWRKQGPVDRPFCVAGVLKFLGEANDEEKEFYAQQAGHLPLNSAYQLTSLELESLRLPASRGLMANVLKAIGHHVTQVLPQSLHGNSGPNEALGSVEFAFPVVSAALKLVGAEEFELTNCSGPFWSIYPSLPPRVCLDASAWSTFTDREQRFLAGQIAMSMITRGSVLHLLSTQDSESLLSSAIGIFKPDFKEWGKPTQEVSQKLKSHLPPYALESLERAVNVWSQAKSPAFEENVWALTTFSEDRMGLLMCADVFVGLSMRRKQFERASKPSQNMGLPEDRVWRELINFAISDDFFRFRQKLGLFVA